MSITGMNRRTGEPLSGDAHIWQSVEVILNTPKMSRVMRRHFGSDLFDLIDSPLHEGGLALVTAAIAEALYTWEPRVIVQQVLYLEAQEDGSLGLGLDLWHSVENRRLRGDVKIKRRNA